MRPSQIITDYRLSEKRSIFAWNVSDNMCRIEWAADHSDLGLTKLIHFWRRYSRKATLKNFRSQRRWPLDLDLLPSYSCSGHVSTKLKVSMAFLFKENRRHGTDGQTFELLRRSSSETKKGVWQTDRQTDRQVKYSKNYKFSQICDRQHVWNRPRIISSSFDVNRSTFLQLCYLSKSEARNRQTDGVQHLMRPSVEGSVISVLKINSILIPISVFSM